MASLSIDSLIISLQFAVCLLIIFIAELAVGIAAAVYKSDFGHVLKSTLKKSMANYSENSVEKISWDNVQMKVYYPLEKSNQIWNTTLILCYTKKCYYK